MDLSQSFRKQFIMTSSVTISFLFIFVCNFLSLFVAIMSVLFLVETVSVCLCYFCLYIYVNLSVLLVVDSFMHV